MVKGLLPDVTDRLNLAPLPVSQRRIFAASLAAVAGVAGVFIADVNAFSLFVFPGVVMAERTFVEFLRLLFAHTVAVAAASICFRSAPRWRRWASYSPSPPRGFSRRYLCWPAPALAAALLAMWITAGAPPSPSRWFRALYGPLVGRPELTDPALVRLAVAGLALAILLALAGYAFGYARAIEGQLVRSVAAPALAGRHSHVGARRRLNAPLLPFALRALWRGETQSLLICGTLVMALVIGLRAGEPRLLPLYAGYARGGGRHGRARHRDPTRRQLDLSSTGRGSWRRGSVSRGAPRGVAPSIVRGHRGRACFDLRIAIVTASHGRRHRRSAASQLPPDSVHSAPTRIPQHPRAERLSRAYSGSCWCHFVGAWLSGESVRTAAVALAAVVLIRLRRPISGELFGTDSPPLVFELEQPDVTQLRL